VRDYLHPNGEHVIDWFHIPMRLTVLQRQTKALEEKQPENAAVVSQQLESIKHLWHGNVEEALERLNNLFLDLDLMQARCAAAEKLAAGIAEFQTRRGAHLILQTRTKVLNDELEEVFRR
jgi:hypothetical protein